MKNILTILYTIALLLAVHLLSAQCSTAFALEDFEAMNGPYIWPTDQSFQFLEDGGFLGSNYLKSSDSGNSYLEQCFDLSEHNHYKTIFKYEASTVGALALEYSTNGTDYTQLWLSDKAGSVEDGNIILDVPKEEEVYLRFVATESNVYLDNIQIFNMTIDLIFAYDDAGNRTSEIVVGLVGDETEVSHIAPENTNAAAMSYAASVDDNGEITISLSEISDADFSVYPNPAMNELNISTRKSSENYPVQIYNDEGKLVQSNTLSNHLKLDVSQWISGTYFVYILSGDDKIIYRVIKI